MSEPSEVARVRVSLAADLMDEAGHVVAECLGVRCLVVIHDDDALALVSVGVSREGALGLLAEALRKVAAEVGRPVAVIPLTGNGTTGRRPAGEASS